jgi:TM2 domain-containing membrane protein YozV/ribosomal protein L40E
MNIPTKATNEKFCHECGAIIHVKAEICPKCGVRQKHLPIALTVNFGAITANGKSKLIAALLAFFLGSFGGHKFYLGQIGLGIVYLALCWTFIPATLGIIEGIWLLAMRDERFNEKYGQN